MVHLDVKKLARIPRAGGHRALVRAKGKGNRAVGTGYAYLHHALDDHSRPVYSEIMADVTKENTTAFWVRAAGSFAAHGITTRGVLTDNGACYRSKAFNRVLERDGIKHRHTRPYRPWTNGKVERFNRTLAAEWAYAPPAPGAAPRGCPAWRVSGREDA